MLRTLVKDNEVDSTPVMIINTANKTIWVSPEMGLENVKNQVRYKKEMTISKDKPTKINEDELVVPVDFISVTKLTWR